MKHTPGPWTVQFPTSDDPELAIVGGGRVIADMFGVSGNQPDNARLIAAAPELLKIVQKFVNALNTNYSASTMNYEFGADARHLLRSLED